MSIRVHLHTTVACQYRVSSVSELPQWCLCTYVSGDSVQGDLNETLKNTLDISYYCISDKKTRKKKRKNTHYRSGRATTANKGNLCGSHPCNGVCSAMEFENVSISFSIRSIQTHHWRISSVSAQYRCCLSGVSEHTSVLTPHSVTSKKN